MRFNYISNHGVRPCVFQVPESLKDTNPEAYVPQLIGLGPYHHFRPQLQLMESKKRAAVKDYLEIVDFDHFIHLIDNSPKEFEPIIRSCYDQYLDLDKETLSWILIVDGIVLLHLIDAWDRKQRSTRFKKLVPDVFMLENQIPIILILEMRKVLKPSFTQISKHADEELFQKFRDFCNEYSPLELASAAEHGEEALDKNNRILHYMFHMIMKNKGPDSHMGHEVSEAEAMRGATRETLKDRVEVVARVAADHVSELFQQIVEEFNSALTRARSTGIEVPGKMEKVSQLLRKLDKALQVLHNKEGVQSFCLQDRSAILNIKFQRLPAGSGIRDTELKFVDIKSEKYLKFIFDLPEIHMGEQVQRQY